MSTSLISLILSILIGIPAVAIGIALIWRLRKLHTQKLVDQQEELNRKIRSIDPKQQPEPVIQQPEKWSPKKLLVSIAILAVGIVLYFLVVDITPGKTGDVTIENVTNWSRTHWFWILMAWLLLAGLTAFFSDKLKKMAPLLQKTYMLVLVAIFILVPSVGYFYNKGVFGQTEDSNVALDTSGIPAGMSTFKVGALGSGPLFTPKKWQAYHFKNDKANFETLCVYVDGTVGIFGDVDHPCHDGNFRYVYVRNLENRTIPVGYEVLSRTTM